MTSRRRFLFRAATLGAGAGLLWLARDRLGWPPAAPRFTDGRSTPWTPLPARGDVIEIMVRVNGEPVRAVVDSGAQFTAVDRELAQGLALPARLAFPILAYGVSGKPSLAQTVDLDLAMPGLSVRGLHAAALDLAGVAAASGRDFRLLIGRDVLSQVVLDADFPRRRARFLTRDALRTSADAIAIPLSTHGGGHTAQVQIEGAAPLDLLVDTGASGWIALSDAAARQTGLLAPGRPVAEAHSVGLGGLSRNRIVRARSIRLIGAAPASGVAVRDVEVQIYAPAAHTPAPTGLLGAGLLSQFRIALDLGGGRLFLTPPPLTIVPAAPV